MPKIKAARVLGATALLSSLALSAAAQQPAQEPSAPAERPTMSKPESPPQTAPAPSPDKPSVTPKPSSAKSDHPLVGLRVMSSDGSNLGDVRAVMSTTDGKVTALRIKSGGFLGFGGKIVEIPEGKFARKGDTVAVSLTADEVSKLPEVKS